MRVLVIHNAYQSQNIGGEDVVVKSEVRSLKAKLGKDKVFEYRVSNDDIQMAKLALTIWGNHKAYQEITALIKTQQIDIVHVHNFFPLLTPLVFKAAKMAGAKVVHTLHNYRWWCLSGLLYRQGKGICEQCVTKKMALPGVLHKCYRQSAPQSLASAAAFAWYQLKDYQQYIDAYLVLSDFQKQKVAAWLPVQKLYLKPNAVDLPTATLPPAQKQHYLFVGRLEAAKGIALLLNTWRELPEYFQLDIIGEGESDWRQNNAHSNIRFLGQLPHAVVLGKMAQAKYLVQPSMAYETFGLTIIEAMAQGTPVIALDVGPRAELITHGKNGFLCQPATFKQTLLDSAEAVNYAALSEQAIDCAKQFDANKMLSQQIAIYQQLLAREPSCQSH